MHEAVAGHGSYAAFLARLLEDEVERQAQKQLTLRIRRAALHSGNPLLASAWLDLLSDRAEVVVITGASYRAQSRERSSNSALMAVRSYSR